jgi:hypothetical protein
MWRCAHSFVHSATFIPCPGRCRRNGRCGSGERGTRGPGTQAADPIRTSSTPRAIFDKSHTRLASSVRYLVIGATYSL